MDITGCYDQDIEIGSPAASSIATGAEQIERFNERKPYAKFNGDGFQIVGVGFHIHVIEERELRALPLSAAGRVAIDAMLSDFRLLRDRQLDPALNYLNGGDHDDPQAIVATDVFSWHADRAPVPADTYLCTYFGRPSEGLRNEEATQRVDDPATRAQLLQLYGGADDDGFREFLADHSYDLHYAAAPGAEPFSFGLFNLWRIAVAYPGNPVPPSIHRAPATQPGEVRLLLIS